MRAWAGAAEGGVAIGAQIPTRAGLAHRVVGGPSALTYDPVVAPPAPRLPRVVVCGAGVVGAAVAHALARRGVRPLVVDRGGPAAAASGRAGGLLARDWSEGTPADALSRAGFAMHRELAGELGAERTGYRAVDALLVAAADVEDLERYRRLPNPDWIDGDAVAHQVIGDRSSVAQIDPPRFTRALMDAACAEGAEQRTGVVDGLALDGPGGAVTGVSVDDELIPADVVVLALGPWTAHAQRWAALPQVFATRMTSMVLAADAPAQAVLSEFVARDGRRLEFRLYPRPDGTVYVSGVPEHHTLPDDPAEIVPLEASCAELRRVAAVHARRLADAPEVRRTACYRALTRDGTPLIGPVPGSPGLFLATAHGSWGLLHAPPTGRMIAEMVLDGRSHSLDAAPFDPARLPAGRL